MTTILEASNLSLIEFVRQQFPSLAVTGLFLIMLGVHKHLSKWWSGLANIS
jgi:hypothetical protein